MPDRLERVEGQGVVNHHQRPPSTSDCECLLRRASRWTLMNQNKTEKPLLIEMLDQLSHLNQLESMVNQLDRLNDLESLLNNISLEQTIP